MNLNHVTLPAHDVERATLFYQGMGFRLIVDARPRYVRFECPTGDATLSLEQVERTSPGVRGVVVYFECDDVDHTHAELEAKGYVFETPPTDERWLWREARLHDPSGNALCLFTAGSHRRYPPWRVRES